MLEHVIRNWWMVLLRGLCAIAFGIMAFAWPGITLLVLVLMFAAQALVDGGAAVALGLGMRKSVDGAPWGTMVLVGVVSIVAGIIAFVWPGITAVSLLFVIAFWAIVRGVFEILSAIRLRKVIDNEWMLGLAGAASILFGVLLMAWPGAGLLSLLWLIGSYAIAFGVIKVMLALRLRGMKNRLAPGT